MDRPGPRYPAPQAPPARLRQGHTGSQAGSSPSGTRCVVRARRRRSSGRGQKRSPGPITVRVAGALLSSRLRSRPKDREAPSARVTASPRCAGRSLAAAVRRLWRQWSHTRTELPPPGHNDLDPSRPFQSPEASGPRVVKKLGLLQGRTSRTRLKGESAAFRTREKPASSAISRSAASPA